MAFLGPEVSRTGAYFDRDAIARAANFRALGVGGIEAPLSIYFYTRTGDVGVTEDGRRTGPEIRHAGFHEGVYMIGVADDLSPDEARWVLAHELRHSVGGSHGEAECNDWADVVSTAHPNIIRDVRASSAAGQGSSRPGHGMVSAGRRLARGSARWPQDSPPR